MDGWKLKWTIDARTYCYNGYYPPHTYPIFTMWWTAELRDENGNSTVVKAA